MVVRVGARLMAGGHAVVDVAPVIHRDLGGIDADRLDGDVGAVIGRALPVWTDEDGDGRYVWGAPTH